MSPSNINSFVGDLVQMAKAMEELPAVKDSLANASRENMALLDRIESIRADLEQSRNYAASLEQKVRSLEVERDDASFRVLEAEDLAHNTLSRLRAIQTALGGTVDALDPPKPEPVKEPEPQAQPVTTPAEGSQSEASPTGEQQAGSQEGHTVSEAVHSISELPGQSESSPTVKDTDGEPQTAPMQNVESTTSANTNVPYFGKRYRDVTGYVSYNDWVAGGGAYEDYYNTTSRY